MIQHGDGKASERAEKVAEVIYALLEEKGLVQDHANQSFVDVIISASLLHDLFITDELVSIFYTRQYLTDIAEKVNLPESVRNAIFETIEAQLGDKTPVPRLRPTPGTPTEMFAYAVWFVKKFLS